MRNQEWTNNKKAGKKVFIGNYGKISKSGERAFTLTHTPEKGKPREIAFESYQAAKEQGWVKR